MQTLIIFSQVGKILYLDFGSEMRSTLSNNYTGPHISCREFYVFVLLIQNVYVSLSYIHTHTHTPTEV